MQDSTQALDARLRVDGLGSLSVLHDHLISYITYLLDLEDVVRLGCVSRILRVFAHEEPLWLALSLKLHDEGLVEFKGDWRQTALAAYTARPVPQEVVQTAGRPLPPLTGLQSAFLYRRWYRCHVDVRGFTPPPDSAGVDVVPAGGMSPGEFLERFDRPSMPALLTGLQDKWPAHKWTLDALCAAFPTARFKVSKPHGGRALMTMPAYVDYMARQADEEPLYVFDPSFAEAAPGIRDLYEVPHVFDKDYFSVLGGGRPAFRWLVLGPARAGASWHVDPSLTSAWNALLSGGSRVRARRQRGGRARGGSTDCMRVPHPRRKRWALYPPHMPPPGVPLDDDGEEAGPGEDALSSLQWFLEVYPGLPPEKRPVEFVQEAGQVVFIPGGWWHAVLNLETAVAVTQNYVGDANLTRVVRYLADGSSSYAADTLAYHDPRVEVEAWIKRYPGLPVEEGWAGGCESSGSGSSRSESEWEQVVEGPAEERGKEEGPQFSARGLGLRALGSPPPAPVGCGAPSGGTWGDGTAGCCNGADTGSSESSVAVAEGGGVGAGGPGGLGMGEVASGSLDPHLDMDPDLDLEWAELAVWRRERLLGRWLRQLWEAEPSTRPVIEECVSRHLHGAAWREVLRAVASQQQQQPVPCSASANHAVGAASEATEDAANNTAGTGAAAAFAAKTGVGSGGESCLAAAAPGEPSPLDLIPVAGADALVFLYGDTAIKVFTHAVPATRSLMCALESYAPGLLLGSGSPASEQLAQLLPRPLACGALAARFTPRGRREGRCPGSEGSGDPGGAEDGLDGEGRGGRGARGEGEPAEEQRLLYMVQERLQANCTLLDYLPHLLTSGPTGHQRLGDVGEALGHAVSALHVAAAALAASPQGQLASGRRCGGSGGKGGITARSVQSAQDWEEAVHRRAVWHDREGSIWVSGLGCVSRAPGDEDDGSGAGADGGPSTSTAAAAAPAVPSAPVADGATASNAAILVGAPAEVPVDSPWWPFVSYLRRRRRVVLEELQYLEFPPWVQKQLSAYLPADPATLLGFGPAELGEAESVCVGATGAGRDMATGTDPRVAVAGGRGPAPPPGGPGVPPLLLHGDVTAANIVFRHPPPPVPSTLAVAGAKPNAQRPAPQQNGCHGKAGSAAGTPVAPVGGAVVAAPATTAAEWWPELQLVDFADAGHGDPLFELVSVSASCLGCHRPAMERFWSAYRTRIDVAKVWPARSSGGAGTASACGGGSSSSDGGPALSYVAMCYSLLHEEAEVMLDRLWSAAAREAGAAGVGEQGMGLGGAAVVVVGAGAVGGAAAPARDRTLEDLAAAVWGFLDA
ncbi:hypothetical protein GPECTOR_1g170 [Gonium pectorale]|uniref:JmjC domain-containing protein n=1 Tax=Gonium pectorale TaxID=33097 RepID=A0A150H219_GONPE|nr:hypothetical protein GPECTOR_1g170 [Gonium pectorale]|eukprot:KXZ56197.1 hypothetical protein GPECTOR_1g170 [Gonium pectorale]